LQVKRKQVTHSIEYLRRTHALIGGGNLNGSESDGRDGTWPVLCRVWARNYEAQIIVSMLLDAGVDAMMDCDPRGPMHYYSFPNGSIAPIPIYVPQDQIELARELMSAQLVDDPWLKEEPYPFELEGARINHRRRVVYSAWLLSSGFGAIALVLGLIMRSSSRSPHGVHRT